MTYIRTFMCSKFGKIRPWPMELAALECKKKIPWTNNGEYDLFMFDRILFILAGNEDMHKS